MKSMKTITALLSCILLVPQLSFGGAGTTACQFLKINPSARAAGMAGVCAAQDNDVFAVYANPAGLASLRTPEFTATYVRYFADVNYGYLAYASPLKGKGTIGFSYSYLLIDDIEKRAVDETLQGTFNAQDTALSVAYGRKDAAPSILENLDLGAALKVISSQIDQTIGTTAALDVAASYRPVENVTTALAVQNISYGIKFREVTDPLPLDLKFGVSWRVTETLAVGSDIDEYLVDNKAYTSLGTEYWPVKQLALRAGYRFGYHTESLGSQVGLGVGFGVRIWTVGLDYAFVPFGDLGDTHRISFVAKF